MRNRKTPEDSAVELAVLAVAGDSDVMDMSMLDFDPSPTALDLPEQEGGQPCSRCGCPAEDRCPECGSPLCEDCVAADEGC
jgi:hypothetical protein